MSVFAGSILDNGTKANPSLVYYSGGGGGGGNASTFVTASVSTMSVSSITSLGGPVEFSGSVVIPGALNVSSITSSAGGPNGTLVENGLDFVDGATIYFDANATGGFANISFAGNDGRLAGVSTINGAAYPPAGALSVQTAPLANGGAIVLPENSVGGPRPITGTFATTAGKLYQATVKVTQEDLNPPGNPGASDHYSFVDGAAGVVLTRLHSEVSSIKAGGAPLGEMVTFQWIAGGATTQLSAYNNIGSIQSTLVTLDNTYQCRVVQLN